MKVVQGDDCDAETGADEERELCSCSAKSSKASGSVEAKVGRTNGKGKGGSDSGSKEP